MENEAHISLSNLPSSVLTAHVFRFLDVPSLQNCSAVSKEWQNAVDQDLLWKPACGRLWADKLNVPKVKEDNKEPEELYPFAIFPQEIHLSIKEMRNILTKRGYSTEKLIERAEYERAIQITQPKKLLTWRPTCLSKWKTCYISSVIRSKSNLIAKSELVNSRWMTQFTLFNLGLKFESKFNPDGTTKNALETILIGEQNENNRVDNVNYQPTRRWAFLNTPDGSPFDFPAIIVDNYPPLVVSRSKDWGFVLNNPFVIMHQLISPTSESQQ